MFDVIPTNDETWLICGGRHFADDQMFDNVMGDLIRIRGVPSKVVHGGADGTDKMAGVWATKFAIDCTVEKAEWNTYGRSAGPRRNQKMLDDHKPDFGVAFPGGHGTADMVRRLKAAGIDMAEIRLTTPR